VIRSCVVVAVDGTHASGKTTLVHALAAHYRGAGVLVDVVAEPARTSPFVEETVIHRTGPGFDLVCEVDLFAAQLSAQARAARHQELLICDKTITNVLAYTRLVLTPTATLDSRPVLDAMAAFCRAWAPVYDGVLFCADHYNQPDPMRAAVADLQQAADNAIRAAYADTGADLLAVPAGLTVPERVEWATARVDPLLAAARPLR
jgi:predicted ATPase